MFYSDHLKILDNKIRRNRGPGIHVDHSNENLIKGNRFSRCGDVAIPVEGSDHNRVLRNRLRCGVGIIVDHGKQNVIARNRLRKVELDAIGINKGHDNIVARNDIFRPGGSGVYLDIRCTAATTTSSAETSSGGAERTPTWLGAKITTAS